MANSNNHDLQTSITGLEELVAHQSVAIEELSTTVAKQWDQMDKMKARLDALTARFLDLEDATGPAPENTKPPHY
ncbi:MAG: SlyX family protein [Salaquimonas sp.]